MRYVRRGGDRELFVEYAARGNEWYVEEERGTWTFARDEAANMRRHAKGPPCSTYPKPRLHKAATLTRQPYLRVHCGRE